MENKISEKKFFSMLLIELFGMASLILPAAIVRLAGKNGLPAFLLASSFLFLRRGKVYLHLIMKDIYIVKLIVKKSKRV